MKQSLYWSVPFWLCLLDNWKIHSLCLNANPQQHEEERSQDANGGWRLYSIFTQLIKSAFPITEDPFWWSNLPVSPLDLECLSQAERQQDVDLWALSDAWAAARASWSRGHGHIILKSQSYGTLPKATWHWALHGLERQGTRGVAWVDLKLGVMC